MRATGACEPPPNAVLYNEWSAVGAAPPAPFVPAEAVTVVVSYYEQPTEFACAIAALEGQTYPLELLEVVVVDDGSREPLEAPASVLAVRVVRQEHRGFGLARSRNTGAHAARHPILVFLDGDIVAAPGLVAAHARFHHAVADAVTLGTRIWVSPAGIDAGAIRRRARDLASLFACVPSDPSWTEPHMVRTDALTSRHDDLFRVMEGGNFGIRKAFYDAVGGSDESFTRYGLEDTEFAWRAFTVGGLLVPVRDVTAWHLGRWTEDRGRKSRALDAQRAKVANLIAHPGYRPETPGRIYAVPPPCGDSTASDAQHAAVTVRDLLADRIGDLVVRIETGAASAEAVAGLAEEFGPDPRVRLSPALSALVEFPASPLHVMVPSGARIAPGLVGRMASRLRDAALAVVTLPDGSSATIARAWALHRAVRVGGSPGDFGDSVAFSLRAPRFAARVTRASRRWVAPVRVLDELRHVRGPRSAWRLLRWLALAACWRLARAAPCARTLAARVCAPERGSERLVAERRERAGPVAASARIGRVARAASGTPRNDATASFQGYDGARNGG